MKSCLGAALLFALPLAAQVERTPLIGEAGPGLLDKVRLNSSVAALVQTPSGPALDVVFDHEAPWPNIKFNLGEAYEQGDWAAAHVLSLTVTNPLDAPVPMHVRVDDSPEADGARHCRQGSVSVPPGGPHDVRFDLSAFHIPGMRGQPRNRGVDQTEGLWIRSPLRPLDMKTIVAFQIFMARPAEEYRLQFHKAELQRAEIGEFEPFVDRYGQFTDEDWPGKLHEDAEFARRHAEEEADLAAHPVPAERNRFGGWATGPQLEATGRFRATKHEGKWWFVDPEGRLFWSAGITCVRPESNGPMLGREQYFTWLPEEGDPLRQFYRPQGNGWLDFGRMNLFRKFGADHLTVSHDLAVRRLASWGFNTIGNWSAEEVWRLGRMPYTIPVNYNSPRVPIWERRSFPDVFAPEFEEAVRQAVARRAEFKDDPWLLGVFIENELPWAGWGNRTYLLPATILAAEEDSEMRKVMIQTLRETYASIAELNTAWGTEFASWEALPGAPILTLAQQEKAAADLSRLCTLIAERYFAVCEKAMRDLMPGVLYLGPRFASYNREVVVVAARHCDVVCFNIYNEQPDGRDAHELARELDFPVVIGEFHFGALDRGMFHTGLRGAENQAERAEKFAAYVRTAIAADWCVGTHWFQYRDQALTGRFDGENYNIGFVTITDTTYPEMRAAAREIHRDLYRFRTSQDEK